MRLPVRGVAAAVAVVVVPGVVVPGVLALPPASAADSAGVANAAHRGASAVAPENTLSAVTQAVADRADYVELDVRLTRDGVPVVMHDRTLARTTDVESVYPGRSPWRVEDFTLAEVRGLDAGSWRSPTYARERVPTLAAVLRELSGSASGAFVEVKEPSAYGGVAGIGAAVFDTIAAHWASPDRHEARVQSFDENFVEAFADTYRGVPVSVVGLVNPEVIASYADDMQVNHANVTASLVDDAHQNQLTLGAWTVDDAARMTSIAGLGVDSITTNYPGRLRRTLAALGLTYTGTDWPPKVAQKPTWSLSTSGRFLNTRIPLTATLAANGSPATWQWGAVQRWDNGRWRTIRTRATNSVGRFKATIAGTRALRIRVISLDDWQYPLASSAARDVPLSRMRSTVRISRPAPIRAGRLATLRIRWRSADGRAISGSAALFKRRPRGSWRHARDVRVSNGYREARVGPRRTTEYQVRARAGWWYQADSDRTRVRVR